MRQIHAGWQIQSEMPLHTRIPIQVLAAEFTDLDSLAPSIRITALVGKGTDPVVFSMDLRSAVEADVVEPLAPRIGLAR